MHEIHRAALRCRCGQVQGLVTNATPEAVNHVLCYCDDCQAFAQRLGRADLLDAQGGSDIVQVAPAALTFSSGSERIRGLRLSPKGLYRWYAGCCNTPVGNTLSPAFPFVGIAAAVFAGNPGGADGVFGRHIGAVQGKFAIGRPPPGSEGMNLRLLGRALRMGLGWRLRGQAWPNPFFDQGTRAPRYPIEVLSPAEREALRPLCGPR